MDRLGWILFAGCCRMDVFDIFSLRVMFGGTCLFTVGGCACCWVSFGLVVWLLLVVFL